ncbi:MAG TPA: PHP domain-containing protein [Longimicrobiaceae bacterium]|nr:PHP domain-containing protein [Longimicrobiaceae bacterium]
MRRIDLHVHSHASDGAFSPTAVVRAAIEGGLHVLALADHDTAAGVKEAQAAAEGMLLKIVPAIEVSARHGDAEVHVLGYWIDPDAESVRLHCEASVARREDRMRRMIAKLQEQGVRIEWEDVLKAAGPDAASIGRPHLARALLAAGPTRYYGEAFDRYLRDGGSAFVETDFPSVREAIETIHGAGGRAVWAHPPAELFDREVRAFVECGLDGVECYRPNTPPAEAHLLEVACRTLGLIPTGGSDWHGPHRTRLGEFYVRGEDVQEMLALGGLAAV